MGGILMVVRLAFLGAGNIAEYHAQAAGAAGFDLAGVTSKPGSSRAQKFGLKHHFKRVFSDEDELFRSEDWDALLICSSEETLLPAVKRALEDGRPALVEKPVALKSADLVELEAVTTERVAVAFNRRFYASVKQAKLFYDTVDHAIVTVEIPEAVNYVKGDGDPYRQVRTNSVHMLDLLSFIVGNVDVVYCSGDLGVPNSNGSVLIATSGRRDLVIAKAAWNSPANFSLSIQAENQRFELRPTEIGRHYRGMRVIEPSVEVPIRIYDPTCVKETFSTNDERNLKPGFFEQMVEFRRVVTTGSESQTLASIRDAGAALRLAEKLVSE